MSEESYHLTKPETLSSLKAQLEFLAGGNPALGRLIREGRPLTVAEYKRVNWLDADDKIDEEEQFYIDLIHEYESEIKKGSN
jgi:hypothetical protein